MASKGFKKLLRPIRNAQTTKKTSSGGVSASVNPGNVSRRAPGGISTPRRRATAASKAKSTAKKAVKKAAKKSKVGFKAGFTTPKKKSGHKSGHKTSHR